MAELIVNFQQDISSRIERARINFKKSPKDRITKEYVENRLELLEQLWFEFLAGHKKLLCTYDSAELKATNYVSANLYDKTEDSYATYKCELKMILSQFNSQGNPKQGTHNPCNVKLPKINIPTFSGKYNEWNTFRDLFQSLIHTNKDLDQVQKLQYLKGFLTGEAELLLRNLQVTSDNYDRCWKLLEERYNNKKYICHHILKKMLSQRNLSSESASGLKELIDTTNDCLVSLKNLGINVDSWDILVIHLLTLKLDSETRRQWEFSVTNNSSSEELPTFKEFEKFIIGRYRAIEFLETKSSGNKNQNQQNPPVNKVKSMLSVKTPCQFCTEEHFIGYCQKFINESVDARRDFVRTNNICFVCLGSGHSAKTCRNKVKCKVCKKKHHSILHPYMGNVSQENPDVKNDKEKSAEKPDSPPLVSCVATRKTYNQVLLATALVKARSKAYENFTLRALIDQGSQSSFVTESIVQQLGLKKTPVRGQVSGVGGDNNLISKGIVDLEIVSRVDPQVVIRVKAYVLKSITSLLPSSKIELVTWTELAELTLADPDYHTPSRIDLLLGAEVFGKIIQDGLKRAPSGTPIAQLTSLGWILSGAVGSTSSKSHSAINVLHCQVDDNELLKRFWELEAEKDMSKEQKFSAEETRCEEIFEDTTRRDDEGRYIVRLPFKTNEPVVQNSLKIAEKRLLSLEYKLNKNPDLKQKYKEVIHEYLLLGHMEVVPIDQLSNTQAVYLPHHAVVREKRETTQVRVVFDASCKGTNNLSLNDNLLVGPTLQSELRHTIMRWRFTPICLTADITKMYRQVKVDARDVDFQRILWRDDTDSEMKHYRLLRVTFGTACAPYLAVKTLQQVAIDERETYPLAADKVLKDFYMDDLLTGCESEEEGLKLYKEINELLEKGGFKIHKWTSNSEELIKRMKKEDVKGNKEREKGKEELKIKTDEFIKIVGLTWNRSKDVFRYSIEVPPVQEPVTKRKIISDISRFYDPLGWAGPSIIVSKILIQQLWLAGLDWDEVVPNHILNQWLTYREELKFLQEVSIPRWIGIKREGVTIELHGFSDASKVAYSAVVYTRVISSTGQVQVSLMAAKTKVAPVKQISIPRLELCGAVLLTRLMTEIATVMQIEKSQLHAWTDSTVVLAWINSHPNKWQVFVANRVSEIISKLDSHNWSHVTSKQNPADCASRGLHPSELVKSEMWFQGPKFLQEQAIDYTKPKHVTTDLEQAKVRIHCTTINESIWQRFSSFTKMIRVLAYCRRFVNNARKSAKDRNTEYLTAKELTESKNLCIRLCQEVHFGNEIPVNAELTQKKNLKNLNPFRDGNGILRVGGRLENSPLSSDRKHPILLPRNSHLTYLIVAHAHQQTLHGGPQLMMCYIQNSYWIVGLKQVVKSFFRKCVICVKNVAATRTPLMGQLPSARVTPSRPFKNSGVDYAGPIQIRTAKGRGHKSHKGYICLFVCMATRAVHLEVVTDLTSEGFLQAFKRFVARRGFCSDIWSDNGTNFVGAASELKRLFQFEKNAMLQEVAESLATNGCNWHFIPSHSPNFGGLWEAGVKSVKYHLKRVIGESTLTLEEMSTVLAQIEAVLNSRPLSVITCNEDDEVTILTPGHFLVGEPLVTPPDKKFEASNVSSLRRWQYTQRMLQDFWHQWSREYLTKFYHRYRWSSQSSQPKINDVVVVKEDGLPPCRWLYGKVIAVHPGTDNIVRVVSLKVKNGTIKRPVSKLCLLPVAN